MKRFAFVLFCFWSLMDIKAQIAKWLIPPSYEKIQLIPGIDAIITDSADVKAIWTMDGQQLISCKDELFSFKEGIALSVRKGTSQISIAYKQNGDQIKFNDCNVAHNYPYYSNGKLLVHDGSYFRFIDADGNMKEGKYTSAYPYFNGYATCDTYLNMERQKNSCHFLLDKNGTPVSFTYQGKPIDDDDLQFISSVNDEKIGIVVIKSKVFLFNGDSKVLSPVFAKESPSPNLKEQVKLVSELEQCFLQNSDSTYILNAKYGKNDRVSIYFDLMKRPLSIKRNGIEQVYQKTAESTKTYKSNLNIKKEGNHIGLYWDDKNDNNEILPPQFEEVVACFEDKAFVKLKGKYGMLEIIKDTKFDLKINKGDDIAFRHQKFETSIRADFPTFLLADKVNLEIDPTSGCNIDKTSKNFKNTDHGNFIE